MGKSKVANIPEYASAEPYAIFAVFDLELTGLNPDEDRVVEAAVVLCDQDGKPLFVYETLVNPGRDTGPVHIHHITNDMVINAPKFEEVGEDLMEFFHNRIVVGLNNSLDFSCLTREYDSMGIDFKSGDSLDLSPILRDSKFTDMFEEEIMNAINSQEIEHRALADTLVAVAILPYALEFARLFPERVKSYSKAKVVVQNRTPLDGRAIEPRALLRNPFDS